MPTSICMNLALPRAAKRMSQASANSWPPPRAKPSILAMVAWGSLLMRSRVRCRWSSSTSSRDTAVVDISLRKLVSAWHTKISGWGRLEHHHLDGAVAFQVFRQHIQVFQHGNALHVDRGKVEGDPSDGVFDFYVEGFEAVITHIHLSLLSRDDHQQYKNKDITLNFYKNPGYNE